MIAYTLYLIGSRNQFFEFSKSNIFDERKWQIGQQIVSEINLHQIRVQHVLLLVNITMSGVI